MLYREILFCSKRKALARSCPLWPQGQSCIMSKDYSLPSIFGVYPMTFSSKVTPVTQNSN
ncbi:hypothetical protein Hanom_Chr02g00159701 [Helianthus anomalus]